MGLTGIVQSCNGLFNDSNKTVLSDGSQAEISSTQLNVAVPPSKDKAQTSRSGIESSNINSGSETIETDIKLAVDEQGNLRISNDLRTVFTTSFPDIFKSKQGYQTVMTIKT